MKPVSKLFADNDMPRGLNSIKEINGRWCISRPIGKTGLLWRLQCAWMAFTGRADIVTFTDQ